MVNKTLAELKEIAKKYDIKNISKYKKEELIAAIEECMEQSKEAEVIKEDNGKVRTETVETEGILQICEDGFGFLRSENYLSGVDDVYVAPAQIRRFRLKTGDMLKGIARLPRENERFRALLYVNSVNGDKPDVAIRRTASVCSPPVLLALLVLRALRPACCSILTFHCRLSCLRPAGNTTL